MATNLQQIKPCKCGREPDIHSRWLNDDDIFDGIVCEHCEIGAYSADPFLGGSESIGVIEEWNDMVDSYGH